MIEKMDAIDIINFALIISTFGLIVYMFLHTLL